MKVDCLVFGSSLYSITLKLCPNSGTSQDKIVYNKIFAVGWSVIFASFAGENYVNSYVQVGCRLGEMAIYTYINLYLVEIWLIHKCVLVRVSSSSVMLQFVAVKPCCAFLGTGLIPGVCRLCLHMFLAQINVRASPASVSCRALAPFTSISSTSVLNSVLRCQSITVSHHYCLVASLIHNSFVRCV